MNEALAIIVIKELIPEEQVLISAIVERTHILFTENSNESLDQAALFTALACCHKRGCRLDLEKFHRASDEDFLNDIDGISKNLSAETFQMDNYFLPLHAISRRGYGHDQPNLN